MRRNDVIPGNSVRASTAPYPRWAATRRHAVDCQFCSLIRLGSPHLCERAFFLRSEFAGFFLRSPDFAVWQVCYNDRTLSGRSAVLGGSIGGLFLVCSVIGMKMILCQDEIQTRIADGSIVLDPFDEQSLTTNGYNLSLYDELLVYEEIVLDAAIPNRYRRLEIPPDGLTLQPGVLYLGRTLEYTETRDLIPFIQGRSSLSRLGLFVNVGGGMGDYGYCGTWTLELHCVQPVRIYSGMRICQIGYCQALGQSGETGSRKYQNSRDIQASLMFREFGNAAGGEQLELNFDSSRPSFPTIESDLASNQAAKSVDLNGPT